jgi:PKD repeat protein
MQARTAVLGAGRQSASVRSMRALHATPLPRFFAVRVLVAVICTIATSLVVGPAARPAAAAWPPISYPVRQVSPSYELLNENGSYTDSRGETISTCTYGAHAVFTEDQVMAGRSHSYESPPGSAAYSTGWVHWTIDESFSSAWTLVPPRPPGETSSIARYPFTSTYSYLLGARTRTSTEQGWPEICATKAAELANLIQYASSHYRFWVGSVDPVVSFREVSVAGQFGAFLFESTTTHPSLPVGSMTHQWRFGDGSTATGITANHTFARAGTYGVTLTVISGRSPAKSVTKQIRVGSGIEGSLFNLSTTSGSILKVGEVSDIRLRVENFTGVALTDVKVDSLAAVATDADGTGAATVVPSATSDRRLRGTLTADGADIRDFSDYTFTPTKAGAVRVEVNVSAKEPDGTPVTAVISWDVTIKPTPLTVELTARVLGGPARTAGQPLQFTLNENTHKNKFWVDMKFTNTEDKEITQVRFPDPAEPINLKTRRVDEDGIPIPGVALKLLTTPLPALNGFTLEPKGTRTLSFEYEGLDETDAELSARITGVLDGQAISGRGTVDVKVLSDVLVEFGMKLGERTEAYLSGQSVRATGELKNVSEDVLLGVIVYPTTDGNAGNANVFPTTDDSVLFGSPPRDGLTPVTALGFRLEPGKRVDLSALLTTMEFPVASDAKASWTVRAWRHETDPKTGELVKIPVAETQIKVIEKNGLGDSVSARMLPAEIPERDFACGYKYFTCGLVTGLETFALGGYDFVRFVVTAPTKISLAYIRLMGWTFQMFADEIRMFNGDPEAKKRFYAEVEAQTQSAIEAGRFVQAAPGEVGKAIDASLRKWDQIYRTGDLEQMQFELGRIAGENPDALFEVFVAGIAARKAIRGIGGADNAIRGAMLRADAKRAVSLPERIAAAEASGIPIPKSGAFAAGEKLSLAQIAKYWGASVEDMRALFKIADAEDVLITFRSRSPEAIALIRSKVAWPKAQAIKLKSVNDIDMDFLGYRRSRSGRVEIVEPPKDLKMNYDLPAEQLAAQAKSESIAWVARNHAGLDPDAAARVANRLQERIEEWPAALEKYINPARDKNGKLLTRQTGPNRIERKIDIGFEYSTQGIDSSVAKNISDQRTMRVTQIVDEAGTVRPDPTRRYFEVEMSDAAGADFKSITGDVDFLSILNLDGSFIGTSVADQAKRVRIYGYLQTLLGMQHGESFSFIYGGRAKHMNDVAEGFETAVTAAPGGEAYASHFVKNASIAVDSPNAGVRAANPTGDWLLVGGPPHSLIARNKLYRVISLNALGDTLRKYYKLAAFFLPGQLYRFIDGLTQDAQNPEFDADGGAALRPDGSGGVEQYTSGGSTSDATIAAGGAEPAAAALPGVWKPISVAAALKLGPSPTKLELVPMTQLPEGAQPGDVRVAVLDPAQLGMSATSPWFQPGDEVVIDPGEDTEERATVAALGSLVFTQPLASSHPAGATVILLRQASETTTTTSTTTTSTAPGPTTPPNTSIVTPSSGSGVTVTPVVVPSATAVPTVTTPPSTSPAPATTTTVAGVAAAVAGLAVSAPVAPAAINNASAQAADQIAYTGSEVEAMIAIALLAIAVGLLIRRKSQRASS